MHTFSSNKNRTNSKYSSKLDFKPYPCQPVTYLFKSFNFRQSHAHQKPQTKTRYKQSVQQCMISQNMVVNLCLFIFFGQSSILAQKQFYRYAMHSAIVYYFLILAIIIGCGGIASSCIADSMCQAATTRSEEGGSCNLNTGWVMTV